MRRGPNLTLNPPCSPKIAKKCGVRVCCVYVIVNSFNIIVIGHFFNVIIQQHEGSYLILALPGPINIILGHIEHIE